MSLRWPVFFLFVHAMAGAEARRHLHAVGECLLHPWRSHSMRRWPFIRYGGILMGDDFAWPGVELAVREFSLQCELEFELNLPKWILRKPDKVNQGTEKVQ